MTRCALTCQSICKQCTLHVNNNNALLLENEKFFELKSREYRDGIIKKETR